MTTNMQQGTLLDVLKKKMRQTKEEMEKYKDECEEYHKKLQLEAVRREEVSNAFFSDSRLFFSLYFAPDFIICSSDMIISQRSVRLCAPFTVRPKQTMRPQQLQAVASG